MKHTNHGYFGEFGGSFVPKELQIVLDELAKTYTSLSKSSKFQKELCDLYKNFANRPSLLYFAKNLTNKLKGPKIYLKREDLNHTGAHKINNALGQALVARHMGKNKLIAETGAGQHGVATATVAAYFGMKCDIYMGERDVKAQKPNVYRMQILGANVIPVTSGQKTLKDAVDAAFEAYMKEVAGAYYLLGSVVGPHPYPTMVRDFQKVIGQEVREQILEVEGKLPKAIVACVGGGSNAMGAFYDFIDDTSISLVAVEPGGKGITTGRHGATLQTGQSAVIHGFKTLAMTCENGEIGESYSAASGLDYPGVGPELAHLCKVGRLTLSSVTDKEAVEAFVTLSKTEGIVPALESAHAIAYILKNSNKYSPKDIVVINLSGRGDKDVENVYENLMQPREWVGR